MSHRVPEPESDARSLPLDHRTRLARLRDLLDVRVGRAVLVTDLTDIRYFSGFTGSSAVLVVQPSSSILLTDGRYAESATGEVSDSGTDVVSVPRADLPSRLATVLRGTSELVFDPGQLTVADYWSLCAAADVATWTPAKDYSRPLRSVKDAAEIVRIEQACGIAVEAFGVVAGLLENGVTERALATSLEARMIELGADSVAFPSIVGSAARSSMPHAEPSDRTIGEGEPVVIDFGAKVDGYHADVCRTVWFGHLPAELHDIYLAAHESYAAGVAAATAGVSHAEVHRACLAAFGRSGYPERAAHPSGHHLGLAIHEHPYLTEAAVEPLAPGNVITVEPGLYVPGVGGGRIENTILVESSGNRELSAAATR